MISVILSAIPEADENAFRTIVEQQSGYLLKLANLYLHDAALAEDAVQEAFFAFARQFGDMADRSEESVRRRLSAITRNCAVSIWRSRRRELPLTAEIPSGAELPETGYEDLIALIDGLPDGMGALLTLRYVHGYDVRQIARMLRMKERTVYARLAKAKDALRTALIENGYGDWFDD